MVVGLEKDPEKQSRAEGQQVAVGHHSQKQEQRGEEQSSHQGGDHRVQAEVVGYEDGKQRPTVDLGIVGYVAVEDRQRGHDDLGIGQDREKLGEDQLGGTHTAGHTQLHLVGGVTEKGNGFKMV